MNRISIHAVPNKEQVAKNREREPIGERIRAELIDWINRNGVVSVRLDTDEHVISIDIVKLPPEITPVLTCWGSIFIRNEEPFNQCAAPAQPSALSIEDCKCAYNPDEGHSWCPVHNKGRKQQPSAAGGEPQCLGYPNCDGNLPGEWHEPNCPKYSTADKQKQEDWVKLQATLPPAPAPSGIEAAAMEIWESYPVLRLRLELNKDLFIVRVKAILARHLDSECERCSEISDNALKLLSIAENAESEEAQAAIFELRKIVPMLDQYIKWEVEDAVARHLNGSGGAGRGDTHGQ